MPKNTMTDTRQAVWAVGLMTGTVIDGEIDVALLKTDGERIVDVGPEVLIPYRESTIELLRASQAEALLWQFNGPEPAVFVRAERALTLEQSQAVLQVLADAGLQRSDIAVIGFHGQSVLHRPPSASGYGQTRQLGDGALMAQHTGIAVVNDFRSHDMRCGGQGAPLSAVYHQALLKSYDEHPAASSATHRVDVQHLAVLNLGGVGNLSWWDGQQTLVAFDTGPANAPINDWVRIHHLGDYDQDGQLAAAGQVDEQRLARLLEHPYFSQPYPKSLDRFDFGWQMAQGQSPENGAALLTAFAAEAVHRALSLLPEPVERLVVCGGGRHNRQLIHELEKRWPADNECMHTHRDSETDQMTFSPQAAGPRVWLAEQLGWQGDALEAQCFAYLAVRSLYDLPVSFPLTTGVPAALTGGCLYQPT